jgi:hypothetical protein
MVTKEKDASNYTFLKYKNLEDMLKVILFSAQSPLGLVPLLYHIEAKKMQILFIQTGTVGGVTIHYIVEKEKPSKKFIELNRLTGQFGFVEALGSDTQSLYIPLLELDNTSLRFPA